MHSGKKLKLIWDVFEDKILNNPEASIYHEFLDGKYISLTNRQFASEVLSVIGFLQNLDLKKGDFFGIMLPNTVLWEAFHIASLRLGLVVIGIDLNEKENRLRELFEDYEIKAAVVDIPDRLKILTKFSHKTKNIISIKKEVSYSSDFSIHTYAFQSISVEILKTTLKPDYNDPATIIFTSGTTGSPKGIIYTHGQLSLAAHAIIKKYNLPFGTVKIASWLPLSNMFQRIVNILAIELNAPLFFVENPLKIIERLPIIKPTVLIGVPRFFEKIHQNVTKTFNDKGLLYSSILEISLFLGLINNLPRKRLPLRIISFPIWKFLDFLILRKIRKVIGNAKFLISGSAKLKLSTHRFFQALGTPIYEAYGVSENIVPISSNTLENLKIGSVGIPFRENVVEIDNNNLVLIKGEGLFKGYLEKNKNYNELSHECFYNTGDIGFLDKEGFLYLKGRKTDYIKTSTGRRIYPYEIENILNNISFIENSLIIGANRPCLVAILTLDMNTIKNEFDFTSGSLEKNLEKNAGLIKNHILNSLVGLPRYKIPAGFLILGRAFSIEKGELTGNLKICRTKIENLFSKDLNNIYSLISDKQKDVIIQFYGQRFDERILDTKHSFLQHFHDNFFKRTIVTSKIFLGIFWYTLVFKIYKWSYLNQLNDELQESFNQKKSNLVQNTLGPLKGPLFKIGQFLDQSSDAIPEDASIYFRNFLARSVNMKWTMVKDILKKELGNNFFDHFEKFNTHPIYAASMGQVHYAILKSGQEVAVKILYPNIKNAVYSDIRALKIISNFLGFKKKCLNSVEILNELKNLFLRETNLCFEAWAMDLFGKLYKDHPNVSAPKVYFNLSTENVLTMEFIDGLNFHEFNATASQERKNFFSRVIYDVIGESIFRYGFFNADPHPGNFLFLKDKVVFIDFGFSKIWSKEFLHSWRNQTLCGMKDDLEGFKKATEEMGFYQKNSELNYMEMMKLFKEVFYKSWIKDDLFKYSSDFAMTETIEIMNWIKNLKDVHVPHDFVAVSRLFSGMHSVLALLNAESNWHKSTLAFHNIPFEGIDKYSRNWSS